jgi:hypothetical protein
VPGVDHFTVDVPGGGGSASFFVQGNPGAQWITVGGNPSEIAIKPKFTMTNMQFDLMVTAYASNGDVVTLKCYPRSFAIDIEEL